jgi:hypothetical protein
MATSVASEPPVELLGTVELLHDHLTTSLYQTVFQQTRSTERERHWSLEALRIRVTMSPVAPKGR